MRQIGSAGGRPQVFKLPTLGLNKYKGVNLVQEESNPFRVQRDNEMLLMVREQEREYKASFKNEVGQLRVYEKGISSK
jgi:hypothetical protein